jgi:hypothetical protein
MGLTGLLPDDVVSQESTDSPAAGAWGAQAIASEADAASAHVSLDTSTLPPFLSRTARRPC